MDEIQQLVKDLRTIQALKSGGGIHIKPENRGKFTETMKRTGKTAEELCLLFSIKCDPDAADFTVNINFHQPIQMKLNTTKNIHCKFLFSDFSCTQSCVLEILKL